MCIRDSLLALRLAWEWLLHEGHPGFAVRDKLFDAWHNSEGVIQQCEAALQNDCLLYTSRCV